MTCSSPECDQASPLYASGSSAPSATTDYTDPANDGRYNGSGALSATSRNRPAAHGMR
jgi:hypothetical protein